MPVPTQTILSVLVFAFLAGCAPHYAYQYKQPEAVVEKIDSVVSALAPEYQLDVEFALHRAKRNVKELIKALNHFDGERLEAMAFLISHMPVRDLESLSADFLITNVRLAYKAREEVPWGRDIPKDVFFNYVLPYVNINERRDSWREDFTGRFLGLSKEQGSITQAAVYLNTQAFKDFGVEYHATKRHKPDQSPYESIAIGYASCTGLSIIAADVFRSVSIPARLVGIPLWTDKSGNHTWVEVWDHGNWYYLGSAEVGGFTEAWFNEKAAYVDLSRPVHRVYAVSFQRTEILFPTIWDMQVTDVYATDVTGRYLQKTSKQ